MFHKRVNCKAVQTGQPPGKKKITVMKVDFPQRKSFKTSLLDLPLVPVIKTTPDGPSLSRDHDSSGCPPATRIHRLL